MMWKPLFHNLQLKKLYITQSDDDHKLSREFLYDASPKLK